MRTGLERRPRLEIFARLTTQPRTRLSLGFHARTKWPAPTCHLYPTSPAPYPLGRVANAPSLRPHKLLLARNRENCSRPSLPTQLPRENVRADNSTLLCTPGNTSSQLLRFQG